LNEYPVTGRGDVEGVGVLVGVVVGVLVTVGVLVGVSVIVAVGVGVAATGVPVGVGVVVGVGDNVPIAQILTAPSLGVKRGKNTCSGCVTALVDVITIILYTCSIIIHFPHIR